MTCHEARCHWMLFLDSEGAAELHFRISDHLALCPDCAAWFAKQQRFERLLLERLAAGRATPDLWQRIVTRAHLRTPGASRQRLVLGALLACAAVLLAVLLLAPIWSRSPSSELARSAAEKHQQLLQGHLQPHLLSASDEEVERFLRQQVSFPVHCPPRRDANFALQGAGVCRVKEKPAAFFVGQVERERVSIFVLGRPSLDAFPQDHVQLTQSSRPRRSREGNYQTVAQVTADNVVVVIGTAPPEALEKVLTAYGSYH